MISPIKQDDNFEIFSLIWLDNSVNDSSENLDCQRKLRTSINYLKTFEDNYQCEQYIKNLSQNERIILIVNDQLGQQILPSIHDCQQIISIYIYCLDKQINEQWTKQFIKIKSLITRIKDLVQQIQADQRKREQDKLEFPLIINFYNTNAIDPQLITGSNKNFIQSQLIIDYLLKIQITSITKLKLISLCKTIYKNNDKEFKLIQEFEHTYSSSRSISWYTRNCFLTRILNKAFQIENIYLLLNCLFFIHDIQQQFEINKSSLVIKYVYYCQLITNNELDILLKSIGQFISINIFLTTNFDRQQILSILQEYKISNDLKKILFEIDTNIQLNGLKSFIDITSSNGKEIIFMIGSVFRIDNFRQDNNGIFIISMTKYNKSFLDNFNNEFVNRKRTLLSFGHMLWKLNRFDDAEKCYYHLIDNFPDKSDDISKCYHALGNIAFDKDDYDKSLELHKQSLDIKRSILSQYDSSFAYSYNSLGAIYHQKGNYESALNFYKQALDIWKKLYDENHLYIAMCYNNIGFIYEELEKYSEALNYYQKVLNIRQNLLTNDHIELGDINNTLGIIYQYLNQYDLALEYFNKSLLIYKTFHHSNIPIILNNIGKIYENKNQYQQALINYQQAMIIYRQLLPDTHNDIIQTEKYIQNIMIKLEE